MKTLLLSLAAAAGLVLEPSAVFASGAHGHHGTHAQAAAPVAPALADAEVRRIDVERGRITLRHGEIPHLDMPPMTMVFTVKDKALLERVKVGDKVRFMAVSEGGRTMVTDIQPSP